MFSAKFTIIVFEKKQLQRWKFSSSLFRKMIMNKFRKFAFTRQTNLVVKTKLLQWIASRHLCDPSLRWQFSRLVQWRTHSKYAIISIVKASKYIFISTFLIYFIHLCFTGGSNNKAFIHSRGEWYSTYWHIDHRNYWSLNTSFYLSNNLAFFKFFKFNKDVYDDMRSLMSRILTREKSMCWKQPSKMLLIL